MIRWAAAALAIPLALGIAGAPSASSSALSAGTGKASATTTSTTEPPSRWRGSDPPCQIALPEPPGWFGWGTFHTCPPKRVLLIGDSVGLTMGIELEIDEENWGVVVDNRGLIGCGFVTGYQVNADGSWISEASKCTTALATWEAAVRSFKPKVVVVEMGWWDSTQHLVDGHVEQLGQSSYDSLVLSRMVAFVNAIKRSGDRPSVVLLTVPWMDPPPFPDGQLQPAASKASHREINELLSEAVARTSPRSSLFDVSPFITPSGHFQLDVDGGQCRETDGVHLYVGSVSKFVSTPCGRNLQAGLLSSIRESLAKK